MFFFFCFLFCYLRVVPRCAVSHFNLSQAPCLHIAFNLRYDCWTSPLTSRQRLEASCYLVTHTHSLFHAHTFCFSLSKSLPISLSPVLAKAESWLSAKAFWQGSVSRKERDKHEVMKDKLGCMRVTWGKIQCEYYYISHLDSLSIGLSRCWCCLTSTTQTPIDELSADGCSSSPSWNTSITPGGFLLWSPILHLYFPLLSSLQSPNLLSAQSKTELIVRVSGESRSF